MQCNTVIFDMDGLLVNTEPLWARAANKVFAHYGVNLSPDQHQQTMGLRTPEFVDYWWKHHQLADKYAELAIEEIVATVCADIEQNAELMPGALNALSVCQQAGYKIGLASSSPMVVIELVMKLFHFDRFISVATSAGHLTHGKPHPEVYLNCAQQLQSLPLQCIAFEDSFNGMIAAKAARMKCIVVPDRHVQKDRRWAAADLQLTSLQNFTLLHVHNW